MGKKCIYKESAYKEYISKEDMQKCAIYTTNTANTYNWRLIQGDIYIKKKLLEYFI